MIGSVQRISNFPDFSHFFTIVSSLRTLLSSLGLLWRPLCVDDFIARSQKVTTKRKMVIKYIKSWKIPCPSPYRKTVCSNIRSHRYWFLCKIISILERNIGCFDTFCYCLRDHLKTRIGPRAISSSLNGLRNLFRDFQTTPQISPLNDKKARFRLFLFAWSSEETI